MSIQSSQTGPFIVFGPSKSGTTWIQKMLDAHPDVSCEFQPEILIDRKREKTPGLGVTRVHATPFAGVFSDQEAESLYHAKRALFRPVDFLRADYPDTAIPGLSGKARDEILRLHRLMVRNMVESYLTATSDKPIRGYKTHADIDFLIELFPDARVIFLVRDGRDVCVSMRHHRLRQGVYYQGDERWTILRNLNKLLLGRRTTKWLVANFPSLRTVLFRDLTKGPLFCPASLDKAGGDWNLDIDYILRQRAAHPDNQLLVRYEDLLSDPSAELSKILSFIGADATGSIVEDIVEKTSMTRLKGKTKGGFFRKGISGDWRNAFTENDVEQFKILSGDRLQQLGYEDGDDWTLEQG